MKKTVVINVSRTKARTIKIGRNQTITVVLYYTMPVRRTFFLNVRLVGEGAKATILGFVAGRNGADMHLYTTQSHEAKGTTSDLLVKSALSGNAKFSFAGAIKVAQKAQKTDAYQRNENLLLSDGAYARSDPALEILANDVRCTHGATVGKISDDELWYLASRGISPGIGKALLVRGFFEQAIARISDTMVAKRIREVLLKTYSDFYVQH